MILVRLGTRPGSSFGLAIATAFAPRSEAKHRSATVCPGGGWALPRPRSSKLARCR
jgi:hypothetical protein